jgi:enoyl-CoA hydratase/carnithine racemase
MSQTDQTELPVIRSEVVGGIATVTFDDDATRNALSPELAKQLIFTLGRLDKDPAVRVVVLTGAGSAFSSGGNLRNMANGASATRDSAKDVDNTWDDSISSLARRTILTVTGTSKPVIAAVNGPAYGWGMDIALACDLRVASVTARFASVYVRRGLVSGVGATYLLPRLIGPGLASELLLTGRVIDADEALRLGLVNRVVDSGQLLSCAAGVAEEIATAAPLAVELTKRAINSRSHTAGTIEDALHELMYMSQICLASADHREAAQAVLEKRPPNYRRA